MYVSKRVCEREKERERYLCCRRYCAICMRCGVPVMVMMRSLEPGSGSAISMPAPLSARIFRMRDPAFPIIAPASYRQYKHTVTILFSYILLSCETHRDRRTPPRLLLVRGMRCRAGGVRCWWVRTEGH